MKRLHHVDMFGDVAPPADLMEEDCDLDSEGTCTRCGTTAADVAEVELTIGFHVNTDQDAWSWVIRKLDGMNVDINRPGSPVVQGAIVGSSDFDEETGKHGIWLSTNEGLTHIPYEGKIEVIYQ